MVNILIADDNINYAINLMNYINKTNKNIKVCNISKNGKETLEILNNKNNIDIILLDYKMPFYNGQQILDKISDKNKYNDSFIIISGQIEDVLKLKKCDMIHSIYFKTIGIDEIIKKINELSEYKEFTKINNEYKKKIIDELLYLGYNISHKGTQYLIKVINYIASNPYEDLDILEKDIYPKIATIYNVSEHSIKCRINSSTTAMYYNCEIEKLKKYFNLSIDTKPKVKTVINTILSKINYN